MVARIGGDEFVVLAVGAGEVPEVISARVQALVDQFNKGRCRYSLSLSIGVTSCRPQELKSVDEMLADADALMYINKERRRHEER
ncbi:diguanylate cyclase (GGDEF) domain protein [compost metagenome]